MFVHLVLEGFAESSLAVALDIVWTASHLRERGRAPIAGSRRALLQRVVSLDGDAVSSSVGRPRDVDGAFSVRALREGDVILMPGIFSKRSQTADLLLERPDVLRAAALLTRAAAKGVTIAASCSATFVLAASGMLDGRSATTSWWLAPEFARRFPKVALSAEQMVIDQGGILTAGAALAHTDLTLATLARVAGTSLAHLVTRYLVIDPRPSQARYVVLDHLRADDPALLALETFVAKNIARQISLEELGRIARMSPRTLARHVRRALDMTPLELVHRLRVRHAVHLLETTRSSVEDIATQVGYADAAAFRRLFRRYADASPTSVRAHRHDLPAKSSAVLQTARSRPQRASGRR